MAHDTHDDASNPKITSPMNVHIVTAICSWLPVPDLKQCRLVSQMWNDGAIPILKKLSAVQIKCNHTDQNYRNARLFTGLSSLGMPDNVEVIIQDRTEFPWHLNSDIWGKEFANLVFSGGALPLKKLTLRGNIDTSGKAVFVQKLLKNCARNLTQLNLSLIYEPNDKRLLFREPVAVKQFDSVKILDLSCINFNSDFGLDAHKVQYLGQLMAVFRKLEDLTVDSGQTEFLVQRTDLIPRTVVKLQISGRTWTDALNDLLQITHLTLRSLTLIQMYFRRDEDDLQADASVALYNLLSRHCRTLEYLTLELVNLPSPTSVWRLPIFRNLKRFNFKYPQNFEISFETGDSNFSTTFPQIREFCLTYAWKWWGSWEPCSNYLLSDGMVCGSLKHFEIRDKGINKVSHTIEILNHGVDIDAKYARVFKMFPNADNKFVQNLRKYFINEGTVN